MATSPKAKELKILTDEEIVAADDLKTVVVEIPEWGGAVKLRQLSRAQWKKVVKDASGSGELDEDLFELYLIVESMVEPNLTADRVEQLRQKNATVLEKLVLEVLNHSEVNAGALESLLETFRGQ